MQYTVQISVLLGQPAGEAESTARGPSQVEHEKSRTGEVLWLLGSERCRFFIFHFCYSPCLCASCQTC